MNRFLDYLIAIDDTGFYKEPYIDRRTPRDYSTKGAVPSVIYKHEFTIHGVTIVAPNRKAAIKIYQRKKGQ